MVHEAIRCSSVGMVRFRFRQAVAERSNPPSGDSKNFMDNVRKKANVTGRWHDNRHTLITDLAESGTGDETIRDIAGHVSKQMLKHYSHIRMAAKRQALESIVAKPGSKGIRNAVSVPGEPVEAVLGQIVN